MHAYVFGTCNGVFYILLMYATCVKPICIEVVGLALVLVGCTCLYMDIEAEREDGVKATAIDYIITLGCSLSGALYFYASHTIVK